MAGRRILVLNPNSNERVTRGLEAGLAGCRAQLGAELEFATLAEGPFGIESDEDIRRVEPLVEAAIAARDDCDACVIACYSDPGLERCRAATDRPVYGMQESALAAAIACGGQFGVLALSDRSIERHLAYLDRLGLRSRLAGERALDVSVDEAAGDPAVLQRVVARGRELVTEDGARTVVLGCAGLAGLQAQAADALGVPVIEPVQAAVGFAAAALSWRGSRR